MPRQQVRRWVFTLNNYTEAEVEHVKSFFATDTTYGVFGYEEGEQGTPHLQGFIVLSRSRGLSFVRRFLPRAHWEPSRGTNEQARNYCIKDGSFHEHGRLPRSGQRSDLRRLFDWATEFEQLHRRPPGSPEIAKEFPAEHTKYSRVARTIALRATPPLLREGELRDWQGELAVLLEQPCDSDRVVTFVLDEQGGKGKTWFQQYMYTLYPDRVQLLTIGKKDDIAHCIDTAKDVFFFNVPRGGMEYLSYQLLEQLKDRMVFSPKYMSTMKILALVPHVIVFCNEQPDYNKMTGDRYNVINI